MACHTFACNFLPVSYGNGVILIMGDRFSKACKFIPLPKLPSDKGITDFLLQHVVRMHGYPTNLVSHLGSQFTS